MSSAVPLYVYTYTVNHRKEEQKQRYIELYRLFISPEMREKRRVSWRMLERAIQYEAYAELIISQTLMERYFIVEHKIVEEEIYQRCGMSDEEIENQIENEHKLEELIYFYKLLSATDLSEEFFSLFDFYYYSWRPLLYWYAHKMEEQYQRKGNNHFSAPPTLRQCLNRIDDLLKYQPYIYKNPERTILGHPMLSIIRQRRIN